VHFSAELSSRWDKINRVLSHPDTLLRFAFATGTAVALIVLFHAAQRLFASSRTLAGAGRRSSVADLFVQSGHVLAALLLVPGIVREAMTHESIAAAALWAAAFVLAGIVLIQIAGELGIRLLLRSTLAQELSTGNVAAGVAAGANYVAIGILAAPAIAGSDLKGLGLSTAFFGIAVATLALYVALFRALTTYDDAEQIQGENLAAAVSYAGVSVAIALVLARAVTGGDFTGWADALNGYAGVAAGALALYPIRQIIVQGLLLGRAPTLRGGSLDDAIGVDRNAGMAAMEALTYLAAAVAIVQLT
jgi:uncharacterized membrane protein YjfL (UPF0719 family)